jgi:hypothetical protein
MHKTRISMKHETALNLEIVDAGKHCNISHRYVCKGRIADKKAS